MAYRDLPFWKLRDQFGISDTVEPLELPGQLLEPSTSLREALEGAQLLPLRNEKIKSKAIVSPVLLDSIKRNRDFFTLHSGENLPAQREVGITGECDFFISKNTRTFEIGLPILAVVVAKKDVFHLGVPPCAAQMVGTLLMNRTQEHPVREIYGCVTTAEQWRFMHLQNNHIIIDKRIYDLRELPVILGISQYILDHYRDFLSAQGYQAEEPVGTYGGYWPWDSPNIPAASPVFQ